MQHRVTIVIPLWKEELTNNEEISLRQGLNILSSFKFSIITYEGLRINSIIELIESYDVSHQILFFPKKYFLSISGYNRLMLSLRFYYKFLQYNYILIYQLDSFIFKNELLHWVNKRYSYIGAPWIKGGAQENTTSDPFLGVGNGGFSLRNVKDHLRILLTLSYLDPPKKVVEKFLASQNGTFPGRLLLMLSKLTVKNNTFFLFNDFHTWNMWEDWFWGRRASNISWFTVPDGKEAVRFSIEKDPVRFIKSSNDLPFGCHAWWKYDLDFWKPHIESFNHNVSLASVID